MNRLLPRPRCGRPHPGARPVLAVALSLALGLTVGCCRPAAGHLPPRPLYWVVPVPVLARVRAAAPRVAARTLGGRSTFALAGPAASPHPGTAVPATVFTSYGAFARALRHRSIPPWVRALAYDPERWPATPPGEQQAPLRYLALFATAARRAGYPVILMPGRDLTLPAAARCRKGRGETLDQAFLRCGLAKAAKFTHIFELQCAPEELRPARLAAFVTASVRQARAVNHSVIILATLSTISERHQVSGAQIYRAEQAIRRYVQGFQLNAPAQTTAAAVGFLRRLPGG